MARDTLWCGIWENPYYTSWSKPGCWSTSINDGVNTQTNVTLNADFGSFVSSDSIPLLEPDSSRAVESLESLNLTVGQYQGTYTVKSDSDDVTGPNFWIIQMIETLKSQLIFFL